MYDWRIFLIFGAIALLLLFGMGKRANAASGPSLGDAVLPLMGFIFFGVFFVADLVQSLRHGTPTTLETVWGLDRTTSIVVEVIAPATAGIAFLVLFIRSVMRALRGPKPDAHAPTSQSH